MVKNGVLVCWDISYNTSKLLLLGIVAKDRVIIWVHLAMGLVLRRLIME